MRNGGKWRDFEPFWLTWNLTWTRKTKREERNSKNELRLDAMGFGKKNSVTAAICGQINEVNASPLSAWEGGGGGGRGRSCRRRSTAADWLRRPAKKVRTVPFQMSEGSSGISHSITARSRSGSGKPSKKPNEKMKSLSNP